MNKEVEEAKRTIRHLAEHAESVLLDEEGLAINILLNYIQELEEKDKKYIVQLTDEQYRNLVDNVRNEYKQKIRDKIEELILIKDNGANAVRFAMSHEDEIERTQKQRDINTMIKILQELLNEEK